MSIVVERIRKASSASSLESITFMARVFYSLFLTNARNYNNGYSHNGIFYASHALKILFFL